LVKDAPKSNPIRACLGIIEMTGNEGHWGGGISTISQNFPKSPSILLYPLESSISQISPKCGVMCGVWCIGTHNNIWCSHPPYLQRLKSVTFYLTDLLLSTKVGRQMTRLSVASNVSFSPLKCKRALLAPGRPEGRGPPDGRRAVRSNSGRQMRHCSVKKRKVEKNPVATLDHIACNMTKEIRNIQKQHLQHSKNNTRKHQTSRSTLQHYNMEKIMVQHDERNLQHSKK
jgi:hypothetical protein